MSFRRISAGILVAIFTAVGWAAVTTANGKDDGKGQDARKAPPKIAPFRGHDDRHEHEEVAKLNEILLSQRRILDRLDGLGGPSGSIASLHDDILAGINASQLQLLEALGGLQSQCSLPDLLPVPDGVHEGAEAFCQLIGPDFTTMKVTVRNEGGISSSPAMVRVNFLQGSGPQPADQPIGVLGAFGGNADLIFTPRAGCFPPFGSAGACDFVISVDVGSVVNESNEVNNTAIGKCNFVI